LRCEDWRDGAHSAEDRPKHLRTGSCRPCAMNCMTAFF
jgi:hypothetical protein